jgi:hypothetical protein
LSRSILRHTIDFMQHSNWISSLAMLIVLLGTGLAAFNQQAATAAPLAQNEPYASDLIISEYIDGANNDKAIEIYNGTNSIITLNDYVLEVYNGNNNNGTVLDTFSFRDANIEPLGSGVALVIVNSNASSSMQISGSIPWSGLVFDGDDAIVLRNTRVDGNNVVDSIGRIGRRGPWSNNGVSTQDEGLRRKPHICFGRINADAPFDPSIGWTRHGNSDYRDLGNHTVDCTLPHPDVPIINEFVFRHIGGGDPEYVEIKGPVAAPYNRFWILVVNGNADANPGRIEHAFHVSSLPVTDGVYRTVRNRFEDGTKTILLVRDFFGQRNDDIDPGDVGTITNPLWNGRPLDAVAVLRNNAGNDTTYARGVVLGPYFDGKPEPPGGASRFPDDPSTIVNERSISAWTRNDFNGNGLNCAECGDWTPSDEAVNTPGQRNRLGSGPPPTGTVTPTGSVTPTATATRTPGSLPANCVDVIINGSFERNHEGWKFGDNPVAPRFSSDQRTEGLRSVLLGNPPGAGTRNVVSFSSVRQLVKIPHDATVAYLTWKHLSLTQEAVSADPNGRSDRQDMIVLATNQMPMAIKYRARLNDTDWKSERKDLTEFIGKNFYIYFNVFNDGNGKRTWMYLDDVQLAVCYPPGVTPGAGAATPTPIDMPTLPPTSTPTATATHTPTLTPTATDVITDTDMTATPTVTPTDVITDTDNGRELTAVQAPSTDSRLEAASPDETPDNTNGAAGSNLETDTDGTEVPVLTADGCLELVINGDFEKRGIGWTIPSGTQESGYTSEITYDSSRQAMRVGSLTGANIPSISSVVQLVDLPPSFDSYELTFQYYPVTDPDPGPGDLQYVDVYNQFTGQFEMRVLSVQENDRTWKPIAADLAYLAGEEIRLAFSVDNDGVSGRSTMYIDNVSLKACGPPEGGFTAPVTSPPSGGPSISATAAPLFRPDGETADANSSIGLVSLAWLGPLATWLGVFVIIALLVWGIIYALRSNDTSGSTTGYQGRIPAMDDRDSAEDDVVRADDFPKDDTAN